MKASLDQLARNLASGVSRRKALWQFVSGLGILGALTGRKASGVPFREPHPYCLGSCQQQADLLLALCLEASESCSEGYCAELCLSGIGINATTINPIIFNGSEPIGVNGGPFICVPQHYGI
jgi:hypothetical protein